MKTKKLMAFAALCVAGSYASAQDLIVKKDGSVIHAQVTKIGTSEVEYKKWSNQNGPQYSIAVADILAINYQNGEKEMFENVGAGNSQAAKSEADGQQSIVQVKPEDLSQEAKAANDALIAKYNEPVSYDILEKHQKQIGVKKANRGIACLQATPNSLFTDGNIEVTCEIGCLNKNNKNSPAEWSLDYYQRNIPYFVTNNPAIRFSIKNKTNQTIYLDLANTFYVSLGQSICYYIPSSTTNSHSSSGGGSINLGAVTGALGLGGAVGTIANGVNVGGGSTNTTTNTTYSQRIVAIAPQSTINLTPQYLFCNNDKKLVEGLCYDLVSTSLASNSYDYCVYANFSSKSQSGQMKVGDNYVYSIDNSPVKLSFFVAYSKSEQCTDEHVLQSHYYLSHIFGNSLSKQFANYHLVGNVHNKNSLLFAIMITNFDGESFPKQ